MSSPLQQEQQQQQQQQEEEEEEEEDTCIISGYECEYMNREMHIIIFMNTHTERERERRRADGERVLVLNYDDYCGFYITLVQR